MTKKYDRYDRRDHDRNRDSNYDQKKKFNPLFSVRVSAGLKNITVPPEMLKEMKINPDIIRQNRRGDTIIPLKVSGETGLVLNPGIRPNYWLLASKEFKRGKFAQIVAGENGAKLRGGLGRNGEVYFSVNQTRVLYLVQAHEGKDFVVIRRYKLGKNEDGDQNYLIMDQIFPSVDREGNEFANAYHLTMPTKLLETVKGHLPEEIKFLAEAVTAALEKVHSEEDYPAYAEVREQKQETEQKSEETSEEAEEIPEEPDLPKEPEEPRSKKEKTPKKPEDKAASKAAKEIKAAKEKAEEKVDEQEIQEAKVQEDEKDSSQSKEKVDEAELEKVQKEAEGFTTNVLSDALEGLNLKKEEKTTVKKSTPRTKSTAKKSTPKKATK